MRYRKTAGTAASLVMPAAVRPADQGDLDRADAAGGRDHRCGRGPEEVDDADGRQAQATAQRLHRQGQRRDVEESDRDLAAEELGELGGPARDLRHPLARPLQQRHHAGTEELPPPREQEEEAE